MNVYLPVCLYFTHSNPFLLCFQTFFVRIKNQIEHVAYRAASIELITIACENKLKRPLTTHFYSDKKKEQTSTQCVAHKTQKSKMEIGTTTRAKISALGHCQYRGTHSGLNWNKMYNILQITTEVLKIV